AFFGRVVPRPAPRATSPILDYQVRARRHQAAASPARGSSALRRRGSGWGGRHAAVGETLDVPGLRRGAARGARPGHQRSRPDHQHPKESSQSHRHPPARKIGRSRRTLVAPAVAAARWRYPRWTGDGAQGAVRRSRWSPNVPYGVNLPREGYAWFRKHTPGAFPRNATAPAVHGSFAARWHPWSNTLKMPEENGVLNGSQAWLVGHATAGESASAS